MVRFFAEAADISGGLILLSSEDTAHMRSLRLRPTELFVVCDGEGSDHICRLSERGGGTAAEIVETRPSQGEPSVACSVFIALAKGDRLDYAVQKTVELGAYRIYLFPSERCVSVPGDMSKKTARLQRIALETAKQSDRGRVPRVMALRKFETAIKKAACADLPLFFYECEDKLHLNEALGYGAAKNRPGVKGEQQKEFGADEGGEGKVTTVSIVTGPEGGFEPHEAQQARAAGLLAITMGPRILRCETAPVAALAAVMFCTGNL